MKRTAAYLLAFAMIFALAGCGRGSDNVPVDSDAVSYTHLDVYKRQVIGLFQAQQAGQLRLYQLQPVLDLPFRRSRPPDSSISTIRRAPLMRLVSKRSAS